MYINSVCLNVYTLSLQVSRSIGDAYLKKAEFNRAPLVSKFRLAEPFHKPILSYEPSVAVHQLCPHDQFLIFASDGLWEHMSNQEAVDIVHNYPRNVRFLMTSFYFCSAYMLIPLNGLHICLTCIMEIKS